MSEETVDLNQLKGEDRKNFYRKLTESWVPYDPRFPNMNQTRNCQVNYLDYHRCLKKTNGDEDYCHFYKNAYMNLCPPAWREKWDEQRANGVFPFRDVD